MNFFSVPADKTRSIVVVIEEVNLAQFAYNGGKYSHTISSTIACLCASSIRMEKFTEVIL